MKARYRRKNFKIKFVLLIVLSTCLIHPNYLVLSLRRVHASENGGKAVKMLEYPDLTTISSVSEYDTFSEGRRNSLAVPNGVALIMSLIFAIAPFCGALMLGFLKDQPLDKQGLVNHLFQDLIKGNYLFVFLWKKL